ncbi:hypothetical protein HOY82DRAFT_323721 [Tuber indicum]|nr:hypothetical protein HOY82DRAFT_323721 [Tuber indicum]
MDPGFLDANIPTARRWFCTIDTRAKCHACGLQFDLVHVFDSSGEDTFPEGQKAAADEHRTFCPIIGVNGWSTDITEMRHPGDYRDQLVDALNRGDDIMSIMGEDYYDELIRPRLSRERIAAYQRYLNRKALAAQVMLKHCPKCLRASSTTLMGKRMHERVCQLTRFDWVTLAEVQPLRTQEDVDGREMVMNSNGSLESRFRVLAPGEKARLERKYQQQLYTRLNMDEKSLAILGDDNDSSDVPSDQDDNQIPRRHGPRRRRPHRRPIHSDNSDDENDYGPGRGRGRIASRRIPTLEEYNSWHEEVAPTILARNNESTEQMLSRFQMEFQEMLRRNDPIAIGVPAPQPRPPLGTPLPANERKTVLARKTSRTRERNTATTGQPQARIAPLRTNIPALSEADAERPIITEPSLALQRAYDKMPEGLVSALEGTGLNDSRLGFGWRVHALRLLNPAWNAQNARADALLKQKMEGKVVTARDTRPALQMYIEFFSTGGLITVGSRSLSFLEILCYPDATLETDQLFMQLLFPIDSTPRFDPSISLMPTGLRRAMTTTPALVGCFMLGVRRIMAFWGFEFRGLSSTGRPLWRLVPNFLPANHAWTRRVNHNHHRVTRLIRCMHLIGGSRGARSIYRCIARAIRERNLPVNERSQRVWRRTALGPLNVNPLAKVYPPDTDFRTDSEPEEAGEGSHSLGSPSGSLNGSLNGSKDSKGGGDGSVGSPVDSPGLSWEKAMDPGYNDNSDSEDDPHTADISSSSEGFLDPHERDVDFIPKRLPSSPIDTREVPAIQPQETQQTPESNRTPVGPRPRPRIERKYVPPPTRTARASDDFRRVERRIIPSEERARLEKLRAAALRESNPDITKVVKRGS